ncbi:hypothetical protein VN0861_00600 [Helicobacter pylori]
MNKNQNYYKEELQKLSVGYGVPLSLCYGKELFENLNILQVWDEVLNHLVRWRETLPDLPSLNFDENPLESFKEIKDLAPSVYRKLLDNDEIFNLVLILFPEQKVLKRLAGYFRQQNKTIYQQLASKLEERLSSKENHQKNSLITNNGFISTIALILGGQAITTSTAEAGEQPSLYSALPNLALVCDRGPKVSPISNLFVTNMLCHLHVNGSGSYAFLLYRLGSK